MKKILIVGLILFALATTAMKAWQTFRPEQKQAVETIVTPSPTRFPSVTPTFRPLTFEEMNKKYGPCTKTPVLMYHHIQEEEVAKERGQMGLTVTPEWLAKHIEYLKQKGYSIVSSADIADYFDSGKVLPNKSVVLTLDDAYEDNYLYAWNIFKEFGAKATIFTPTGLVMVHDYMTWDEIREMSNSGLIYFGNHTWSHHGAYGGKDLLEKEIGLADTQLSEKGLNQNKIFAYPYGKPSKDAINVLANSGYRLAFTTNKGNILCKSQRYELPRIRIGNAPLSKFGL